MTTAFDAHSAVSNTLVTDANKSLNATEKSELNMIMPTVDRKKLVKHIKEIHPSLEKYANELTDEVDRKQLGADDVLITAVVPGGLLYGTYRSIQYKQSKNELNNVTDTLDDLGAALFDFQSDLTSQTLPADQITLRSLINPPNESLLLPSCGSTGKKKCKILSAGLHSTFNPALCKLFNSK